MVKYPVILLLGAGASKPLGIPTTEDMAKEFLQITNNKHLKYLISTEKDLDIEKVIRVVQNVKNLTRNEGLKLMGLDEKWMQKLLPFNKIVNEFEITEQELFDFIRLKCLEPDIVKGKVIYKRLFNLGERAVLKIFTTNYDTAIEGVCRELKIEYSDGFRWSQFDDYPRFDPPSFGDSRVQLYKMHGSVNWWSDNSRQTIFRLGLDLKGIENVKNLMIYPAQKEDVFNYPFNLFQSIFITTLNEIDELIAIGHKFNDVNIASAVKVALERSSFRLTIISPSADDIKSKVFDNHEHINTIDKKIEDHVDDLINNLVTKAAVYDARKETEQKQEYTRLKQEIIEEYERDRLSILYDLAKNIDTPKRKVICPKCKYEFVVPASILPVHTQCPKCGTTVTLQ